MAEILDPVEASTPDDPTVPELSDDGALGDDATPMAAATPGPKKYQVDVRVVLAVVAVLGLAVGAYALGNRKSGTGEGATPGVTATTEFKVPTDYVPFDDSETGIKMAVPKDWVAYSTKGGKDPSLRLAVGVKDTGNTVLVRMNAYSQEVTLDNVGDQKAVFDSIFAGEAVKVLVNEQVKLAGLPALFYVYSFTDGPTGVTGIHARYFVFQGRKMVTMIFQALPEDQYKVMAPVFDAIASSLQIAAGPPPTFLEELAGTGSTAGSTTTTVAAPPTTKG